MFFETKVEKFKVHGSVDPIRVERDFVTIDNYKSEVLKYIYDEIKIGPEGDFEIFTQSRIQLFISQGLLRSLFLKDEIVIALNSNNFPAFYALVKSFLEISAQFGYLTYILYEDRPVEKFREVLNKLVFGHKGGLTSEMGVEPINVMTMFDKLDFVLQKIDLSQTPDKEKIKRIKGVKMMRTLYEDVCNYCHPNYMSHLPVGGINKDGYWLAKNPKKLESYKYELYGGFYMHHFTAGINIILAMSEMITNHPKVHGFNRLKNPNLKI